MQNFETETEKNNEFQNLKRTNSEKNEERKNRYSVVLKTVQDDTILFSAKFNLMIEAFENFNKIIVHLIRKLIFAQIP